MTHLLSLVKNLPTLQDEHLFSSLPKSQVAQLVWHNSHFLSILFSHYPGGQSVKQVFPNKFLPAIQL